VVDIVLVVIFAAVLITVFGFPVILSKYLRLKIEFSKKVVEDAAKMQREWIETKLGEIEQQKEAEYQLKLDRWKAECEKGIREDAIRRSIRILLGKVSEHIALFLIAKKLKVDPRDMRFLGTPIDYVIFKGLYENNLEEIVFVEVKSGEPSLTQRERMVKEAIESGDVSWHLFPLKEEIAEVEEIIEGEPEVEAQRQIEEGRK